jgi:2,5-diamino-6-(ribosylamino)-4(3H)-pyrimidinone 5'-phosphate reductase
MHNQISLDGAVSGFQIDPGTYYSILNSFGAQMYLVGSNTLLSGLKSMGKRFSPEEAEDFHKAAPQPNDKRPMWVVPDSEGKLQGFLHVYRRYEHCRDIVILVAVNTPPDYLKYLEERNYTYLVAGEKKVDFHSAFTQINQRYQTDTIITDNTGTLSSLLLEKALIDQISLIVSPTLTGKKPPKLFRELKLGKRVIKLKPLKAEILESEDLLLLFNVVK